MKYSFRRALTTRLWAASLAWIGALLLASVARGYPPAPSHTLFGMVRDQWGEPLAITSAVVILETPNGTKIKTVLTPGTEPGVNYMMGIPMDSGITSDLYKPTALRPFFQFKLTVQIGEVSYLPIEMSGNYSQIGQPGQKTRIDLTLGEDSDGDGLPDAWERALIAALGGNLTLADIRPGDDADGDGISNLDEYLAGTYAFDPADGFKLTITHSTTDATRLEFMAIRGRTYTVYGSSSLQQWTSVPFRVATNGVQAAPVNSYRASDVQLLRVEVPLQAGAETNQYFKVLVQ